ncbi:MAG: flagellin [Syntrophorhabdales bacterium]|jgi:flagellar hook-associated protein 3 FlgL
MRVADAFRYQLYQTTLSNLKTQMDQSTQEIASGKQVMVPSDNPSSYAQNLQILAEQSQNSQYKSNLDSLQALGSYYTTSVNQVGNILSSVQQLATEQASSTVSADSRTSAADTVNDLIQQLVTLGNTKVGDTYIFGGTKSNTTAYSANGTFVGSAQVGQVAVDTSTTVDAGISGQTIFNGTISGETVTLGGVSQSNIDIFGVLKQFSQDLAANNTSGIQTDMANISSCVDLTANNLAYVGTYTGNINNLLTSNSTANTTLTTDSSNLVNVDMAKAISDYSTLSTAYQAALYTMAKVESISILNYLPA